MERPGWDRRPNIGSILSGSTERNRRTAALFDASRRAESPWLHSRPVTYTPLSSRGLGRRILSPETRVRIPVAVPLESSAAVRMESSAPSRDTALAMSQESVDVLKRGMECFERRDVEGA